MTSATGMKPLFAVRELVRRRMGADEDRWDLALVQRGETWDQLRMRYLLDSLLARYPIGSLLLCRVDQATDVIHLVDGERIVTPAAAGAWQLVDGQQRINAFFSLFTTAGHYGSFFLHMGDRRKAPQGPTTRRRSREDYLRYVHWEDADAGSDVTFADRELHLALNRWYAWAEEPDDARIVRAIDRLASDDGLLGVLREIDPAFTADPRALDLGVARERLLRLIAVWRDESIPVEARPLDSMFDVLEAFTRVNRAGVAVAGQDLFFAGVKTLWHEAEATISAMEDALRPTLDGRRVDALVDRMGALRILARLAARTVERADMVPLAVDRLSSERSPELIEAMRRIGRPDGEPVARMAAVMAVVVARSRLGNGLRSVDRRAWDAVLGWAAVHPRGADRRFLERSAPAIDAYLAGSTAFRYHGILGDRFAGDLLSEALSAGAAGEPFPGRVIPRLARRGNRDLRGGRERVRSVGTVDDRRDLAERNRDLLLSVAQRIGYGEREIAWDHIFPVAESRHMTTAGHRGRRRNHPERHQVNSIGNLWGIDARLNESLGAARPAEKFARLRELVAAGDERVRPRDEWTIEDEEIEAFAAIGPLLDDRRLDAAMERFVPLVTTRAIRLVDGAFAAFPGMADYAGDADVPTEDARRPPELAPCLGIDLPVPQEAGHRGPDVAGRGTYSDAVERVLANADEFGCGAGLRRLIERSVGLGLQLRARKYALSITPPSTRGSVLVTLTPRSERDGMVTTSVVEPTTFVGFFPDLPPERFARIRRIYEVPLTEAELDELGETLAAALG